MPRLVVFCWLLLLLVSFTGAAGTTAFGQDDRGESRRGTIERRTRHVGLRRFRAGDWGVAGVTLVNNEEQPVTVLNGVYFDGDELTRYSRRITIPPRSTRQTSVPVRATAGDDGKLVWHPFLYRLDGDETPEMLRASADYVIDEETLPIAEFPLTVVIDDWDAPSEQLDRNSEFAVVMRLAAGKNRAVGQLSSITVPAFDRALDAADHIVLSGNRISESPAGMATLRSWLQGGGRLWIRLDRVDLSTVEHLLGDAVRITEVDRTGLTGFQVWNRRRQQISGAPREFDYPVELVRVIAEDVDVFHEIDGWPVSFTKNIGDGRVLFTTMSDDGWIRRRRPDERATEVESNSYFIAEQPLVELTDAFTATLDPQPLTPEDFEPFLSAEVGFRIPARATVFFILGSFCVALVGFGFFLQRRRSESNDVRDESGILKRSRGLEWMAVAGPIMACAAAAPLVLLGERARQAIPASATVAELVRVEPAGNGIQSTGSAAIYVPGPVATDLHVERTRLVIPKSDRLDGEIRQMVWTDLNEWHWVDFHLSPGLQFVEVSQRRQVASAVRAVATFGPEGLTGRLESEAFTEPTDAIIATTSQQVLAVTMDSDGRFAATRDGQLDPGVYTPDTFVTDRQRLRADVLARLLQPKQESRYPRQPTLLVWTRASDADVDFPEGLERIHTSLLAVPMEFQPVPPGTDVFIPAPLLPFENLPNRAGEKSTAHDTRTREWIRTAFKTDALLRFQIPESVLPLDVKQATLEFRILAPGRTVTVGSGAPDSIVTLRTMSEPAGTWQITLDQPEMLVLDDGGGLHVTIQVGDVERGAPVEVGKVKNDRSWQIDFVRLELSGRTAEAGETR